MKLRYTPEALRELDEVLAYVAEHSPLGARRIGARIQATASLIERHPLSGTRTSSSRIRRIAATPYPYFLFYEATSETVTIIGVRHAARDPSSMPGTDQP